MKILVADDDPTSRGILKIFLRKKGYQVVLAKDGAEALQVLTGPDRPQLAIVDWMMPVMDGPEVCRRLREHEEPARVWIILLTSRDSTPDIVRGLAAGADDFLTKPFEPSTLAARVLVGDRRMHLQAELVRRIRLLEQSLAQGR